MISLLTSHSYSTLFSLQKVMSCAIILTVSFVKRAICLMNGSILLEYPAIPFLNQIRRIIYDSKDLNRQTDYSFAIQKCHVFIGIGWGAMLAADAACAILALEFSAFCRINAFPLGSIYLCSFVYRQRSMQSYSIAGQSCSRSNSTRGISERATSKGFYRFQNVFRLESQFEHHVIFPSKAPASRYL